MLAEVGYEAASLARIAAAAGVSKGVVSYHFAGKDELLREIVGRVTAEGAAFMTPRILAATTGKDRLGAYVRSNVAFMASHRDALIALVEVVIHAAPPNPYAAYHDNTLVALQELLAEGQRAGEFGPFSPEVFAMAVRAAIDSLPARLRADPTADIDACANELAELFQRAAAVAP